MAKRLLLRSPSRFIYSTTRASNQLSNSRLNLKVSTKESATKLQRSSSLPIDVKHSISQEASLLKPESTNSPGISNDLYTIPNLLTYTRIITTPFAGYFIATGQSTAAISLFTYSCVTDLVDGYIARRFKLQSVLGSILDPAADKFLMFTCTLALCIQHMMPLYVASIIIGRDVVLSFVSFYVRYRSLPPPVTMLKYFDMSITTHTVNPSLLGKVNTALQMFYIGGLVLKPAIEGLSGLELTEAFDWYGLLVASTTLGSGVSYLVGRNSFKAVSTKSSSTISKS